MMMQTSMSTPSTIPTTAPELSPCLFPNFPFSFSFPVVGASVEGEVDALTTGPIIHNAHFIPPDQFSLVTSCGIASSCTNF